MKGGTNKGGTSQFVPPHASTLPQILQQSRRANEEAWEEINNLRDEVERLEDHLKEMEEEEEEEREENMSSTLPSPALQSELNRLLHYESVLQSELSLLPSPSDLHDQANNLIRENLAMAHAGPEEEEARLMSEIANLRTLSSRLSTEIEDLDMPTLNSQIANDPELLNSISSPSPPQPPTALALSSLRTENTRLLTLATSLTTPAPPQPTSDPRANGPLNQTSTSTSHSTPSTNTTTHSLLPPNQLHHTSALHALSTAFSQPSPTFPITALTDANVGEDVIRWMQQRGIITVNGDGTCRLNYDRNNT